MTIPNTFEMKSEGNRAMVARVSTMTAFRNRKNYSVFPRRREGRKLEGKIEEAT